MTRHSRSLINKSWQGCRETGTSSLKHCQWEFKWSSHYGMQYGVPPKKLKTELLFDSNTPLLGYLSTRIEIGISKKYLYFHVHCSILSQQPKGKQHNCPSTNEWIKKMLNTIPTQWSIIPPQNKKKSHHMLQHG